MTPVHELAFADPDLDLSVRRFRIVDGLSRLFECRVWAEHSDPDLDLEAIVGQPAAFRLATHEPDQPYAVWSGVAASVEQVQVEESGVSLYEVTIAPHLWLATHRSNYRVYQDETALGIARRVLESWGIEPVARLDPASLPVHPYRVQFGESDYDFVARLLEEDGLTFALEQVDPRGAEEGDARALPSMCLVVTDDPSATGPDRSSPVRYLGQSEAPSATPHVRSVRFGRAVRPGRYTVQGYDYRSSPDLRLRAEDRATDSAREARYEQYVYRPEAFVGDDQEGADEARGTRAAQLGLARARCRRRAVAFRSNMLTLAPGGRFRLDDHPRGQLAAEPLLVVGRTTYGDADGSWTVEAEAVLAGDGFVPALTIAKPRVMGLQSAIVVGPTGEEIFTDAMGRVKVQFHWDRYGARDAASSSWIRVSQAWAGSGYGLSALPRVGHEVLVDFFDGDPDLPVVVGRAHHRGAMPPASLPAAKTASVWRTATTPTNEGYNEIRLDDARGEERVHLRAQKDFHRIVQGNEDATVGGTVSTTIRRDERRRVAGNQLQTVGGDRAVEVTGRLETAAGSGRMAVGRGTGVSFEDGKLVLSNGSASIVLDGPNIYLDALGSIRHRADRLLALHGYSVEVQGRPDVDINKGMFTPSEVSALAPSVAPGGGAPSSPPAPKILPIMAPHQGGPVVGPHGPEDAEFDGYAHLRDLARAHGLKLPRKLYLPPEWNEQVERLGRIAYNGGVVRGKVLDPETYRAMHERLDRRLAIERDRLKRLGTDLHQIFDGQRAHVSAVAERLGTRLGVERANLVAARAELGSIFRGERGNLFASAKALVAVAREQRANFLALRSDLTAMLDRQLAYFERFKAEWRGAADQVREYIGGFKDLIENPRDAVLDIVLGDDDELAAGLQGLADDLGVGDDVADLLGVDGEGAAIPIAGEPPPQLPSLAPPDGGGSGGGGGVAPVAVEKTTWTANGAAAKNVVPVAPAAVTAAPPGGAVVGPAP
ncbi:MAG: type VI secretion system tip protein TssI/VgrG, partial [Myxococcota bacterium]